MSDNNNILRILSTGAVISSATFAKQTPVKQTEILALVSGKPVAFVDSFTKLSNTKKLAERLLAGEDVSMELEFNSITLSDDEKDGLTKVRPLLERLRALKAPTGCSTVDLQAVFGEDADAVAEWVAGNKTSGQLPYGTTDKAHGAKNVLRVRKTSRTTTIEALSGYSLSLSHFKDAWALLQRALENGSTGRIGRIYVGRYDRHNVELTSAQELVSVGCQSVPVSEVVRIATELELA